MAKQSAYFLALLHVASCAYDNQLEVAANWKENPDAQLPTIRSLYREVQLLLDDGRQEFLTRAQLRHATLGRIWDACTLLIQGMTESEIATHCWPRFPADQEAALARWAGQRARFHSFEFQKQKAGFAPDAVLPIPAPAASVPAEAAPVAAPPLPRFRLLAPLEDPSPTAAPAAPRPPVKLTVVQSRALLSTEGGRELVDLLGDAVDVSAAIPSQEELERVWGDLTVKQVMAMRESEQSPEVQHLVHGLDRLQESLGAVQVLLETGQRLRGLTQLGDAQAELNALVNTALNGTHC